MKKEVTSLDHKTVFMKLSVSQFLCRYGFLFLSVILSINSTNPALGQYILQHKDVEVVNGQIQSCSYDFEKKDIVIPDTLDGQQIIGIGGQGVFQSKGIRTLQLPAAISSIGKNAFFGNQLTELDFSNCIVLIDIGERAFAANQFSRLDLSSCAALHSIGRLAFGLNDLNHVDFPENLRIVGDFAFRHNKLDSADISHCTKLNHIGYGAFTENDSLAGFLLPENSVNPTYGWKGPNGITHSGGTFVTDLALYYHHLPYILTEADVSISNGTIHSYNKGQLFEELVIPDTLFGQAVRGIGRDMFHQYSFSRVTLPHMLETIGSGAFEYNALDEVDFTVCPSLKSIGTGAFKRNRLSNLDLDSCTSLISIGYGAFDGNPSLERFKLPSHKEFGELGWKDDADNEFNGDSMVSDLISPYYIPLTYTLTDEDVVMVEGVMQSRATNFGQKDIIIPDTLDGQAVREIGRSLFARLALTNITLPSTLEILQTDAFAWNRLKGISLPVTVEVIGNGVFKSNNLIQVDLSKCNALYSIGSYAFQGNDSLRNINLPVNAALEDYGWKDGNGNLFSAGQEVDDFNTLYVIPVPYTLSDDDVVVEGGEITSCSYSFYFREIVIPDTLDGQLVTAIADGYDADKYGYFGVFAYRGITGIVLPESLERIGNYSFLGNHLSKLDLQGCVNLESIGEYAFMQNRLTEVQLPISLKTIQSGSFSMNNLEQIDLANCELLVSIEDGVFNRNPLDGYALPINAEHGDLGWLASDGSSYQGGDTVSGTGYAVPALYTLKDADVVVENGVIISCTDHLAYRSIVIPDTLDGQIITGIANEWETITTDPVVVQKGVFSGKDLLRVSLPGTLETIGTHAFGYNDLTGIDLSACTALTAIGENAFIDNRFNSFALPDNISFTSYNWEDTDGQSFNGSDTVSNLKSFYRIPAPYTFSDPDVEIRDGILQSCSYNFALWDITIPDTLDGQAVKGIAHREYEEGVFSGKRINRIILPSTLEFIGKHTFSLSRLHEIDLSNCISLTSIGDGAFKHNYNLESLDLSGCTSLASIGDYGFFAIYSLESVNLSGCSSLTSIGQEAFYLCRINDINLLGCEALRSIGEAAFYMNDIAHLNLESCKALGSIGGYAFAYNELTELDLSDCKGLTYIGPSAFDSNGLDGFSLPLPKIPGKEFNYWTDGYDKYDEQDTVKLNKWLPDSYSAIFSLRRYDVYITVTDGINPVQGAEISLHGFGSVVTDHNGMAVYNNLLPQNDLIYTVQAEGFEYKTGSISIMNDNVEIQLTLTKITGIPNRYDRQVKIFPNPCHELITIETDLLGQLSIAVATSNGQLIKMEEAKASIHKFDLSYLQKGVYFITIRSKDFVTTRKIIKL